MRNNQPAIRGPAVYEQLTAIAKGRPIPRDRLEAALFGYSEDEWQEMVDAVDARKK